MKRIAILLSIFILLTLTACTPTADSSANLAEAPTPELAEVNEQGSYELSDRSMPLEEHTVDFTIQEAAKLNYYCEENTIRDDTIYYNEDLFLKFYEVTKAGHPASIRVFTQYDGYDPNYTGFEMYELERNQFPCYYLNEIVYDGKTYTASTWYPHDQHLENIGSLPYLNHSEEGDRGKVEWSEVYFLCEDKDFTFEDIMHAMGSSSSETYRPQYVPLRSVYTYKVSWEDQEKEAEEPYLISAEKAKGMALADLVELALSDRYMISHYFEYFDKGKPMNELVDAAIVEHPYLGICLARKDVLEAFGEREVWHMDDYTDWDQVLEEVYRNYLVQS